MKIDLKMGLGMVTMLVLLAACGGGKESTSGTVSPPVTTPVAVTLQSVAVTPASATVTVGGKQLFAVNGSYSDGTVRSLASGIAWTSSGTVATVDAVTGEATAKAAGIETIAATVGGLIASARLTVATPYMAVSGGGAHTVGIKTDGTLYAWGWNNRGQLGDGTLLDKAVPTLIGTQKTWLRVGAGEYHSVALRSDGTLWSWGFNQNGQLGMGNFADLSVPTQIGKGKDWLDFAVGQHHTLAVNKAGELWAWGRNFDGQLGDGTFLDRVEPTLIAIPAAYADATEAPKWTAVAAGADSSVARLSDNTLWTWGNNLYGQLGRTVATTAGKRQEAPGQVSLLKPDGTESSWTSFAAGGAHMMAIRSDGMLFAWGSNAHGQLGTTSNASASLPARVGADGDWAGVSAGESHSVAIRVSGTLWTWGGNGDGQLGDGGQANRAAPAQVGGARDWVKVSAGRGGTFAIRTDGLLQGWGRNVNGQQGNGTFAAVLTPTPIP